MSEIIKKSPISVLDEFCKRKLQPAAEYTFSSHNVTTSDFVCTVKSFNETKTAKAKSKKKAKHAAAEDLIKHLRNMESFKFDSAFLSDSIMNSINDTEVSSSTTKAIKRKATPPSVPDVNYIGKLMEFCTKNKLPPPSFDSIESNEHNAQSHLPEFFMKCRVNDIERQGKGNCKKEAKKKAAMEVLGVLMESQPEQKFISNLGEPSPKQIKCTEGSISQQSNDTATKTFSENVVHEPQVQEKEKDKINHINYVIPSSDDFDDEEENPNNIFDDSCGDDEDINQIYTFSPLNAESESEEAFEYESAQESDNDEFWL